MADTWTIREDGKNGTVRIEDGMLIRTIAKRLGRDDEEVIPVRQISSVKHDRKMVGTNRVTLFTSGQQFEWKVRSSDAAEDLVAAIRALM